MCYSENTACDSCDAVGLCIVIGDDVFCADCSRMHEELATEFGQDDDEFVIAEDMRDNDFDYDSSIDEGDMYGDDFNPISQGMYDE